MFGSNVHCLLEVILLRDTQDWWHIMSPFLLALLGLKSILYCLDQCHFPSGGSKWGPNEKGLEKLVGASYVNGVILVGLDF